MSIVLDRVTKHYGGVPVVNDVSLDIGDGEFFVLLGPSGSGKSTLLRAIAGLTAIDAGRIALHGRDVTQVAARKRGVGLVFQHYALFRHLSVADNIEFALRVRRMRAAARRARRAELLRLVALEGLDDRLPAQLSGGQQQRVAVARALAHKPEVLLLDEPFGALDAKIREELRRTIRQVQRELGITTVLVTHDQDEAFAMADRLGIMNLGRLLETGAPHALYSRPATRFAATFLGDANLLLARRTPQGFRVGAATVSPAPGSAALQENEVVAVVRPEEVELAAAEAALRATYLAPGTVEDIAFTGALERLRVRLESAGSEPLRAHGNGAGGALQVTRTQPEQRAFAVTPGQRVSVGLRRVHVLPTPLSSFTACAESAALAAELASAPLLLELAGRMRTYVGTLVEPALGAAGAASAGSFFGTTVLAAAADAGARIEWLLRAGAKDVLLLPDAARAPQRVLVHWLGEAAQRATLAVAQSVLRHLPAEADYVTRDGAHAEGELAGRLAARPGQMLILGVSELSGFARRFAALLAGSWPTLVVYRGSA
ncbi:MAG: ABC transporter ATP-binding protein [Gammaproteobacteria bacterium]|nr:ABC transporter ATP-binding protein [Gammaproteobacteria bacterium]